MSCIRLSQKRTEHDLNHWLDRLYSYKSRTRQIRVPPTRPSSRRFSIRLFRVLASQGYRERPGSLGAPKSGEVRSRHSASGSFNDDEVQTIGPDVTAEGIVDRFVGIRDREAAPSTAVRGGRTDLGSAAQRADRLLAQGVRAHGAPAASDRGSCCWGSCSLIDGGILVRALSKARECSRRSPERATRPCGGMDGASSPPPLPCRDRGLGLVRTAITRYGLVSAQVK